MMDDFVNVNSHPEVFELLAGLLPPDKRRELVSSIAHVDPLVAARCVSACFVDDPEAVQEVSYAAHKTVQETDAFHKGNRGLLALLELGDVSGTIEELVNVRITGPKHAEVIATLLSSDDGAYVDEYFDAVRPDVKGHHKLLLMTARGLEDRLLVDEHLRKRATQFGRDLLEGHHYTELKALCRRPGVVMEKVLGEPVEKFVRSLIDGATHKASKHKRLDLAIDIIKRHKLDGFPVADIARTILDDNMRASDLPNRTILLGAVRTLVEKDERTSASDVREYIRQLAVSPGIESLQLAARWIKSFQVADCSVEELVRTFLQKRLRIDDTPLVKEIIEQHDLQAAFPDYELLGAALTGPIAAVSATSNVITVNVPDIRRPCWMRFDDAVKINNAAPVVGDIVSGTAVRISTRGLELRPSTPRHNPQRRSSKRPRNG